MDKSRSETHQNEEGLRALRGFCRWPLEDTAAAGTQGKGVRMVGGAQSQTTSQTWAEIS